MPVAITLHTVPTGSQFTSTIDKSVDPPEPDDKNDFKVRILLDSNGTGLTFSNLSVSEGSIVALEGSNAVWEATVRPPETAVAALTFTVAANAFSEGNTETTLDIRVSTSFPDDDAEAPTEVFSHSLDVANTNIRGIAATPTGIVISTFSTIGQEYLTLHSLGFSGTLLDSQEVTSVRAAFNRDRHGLDYFNGDYLLGGTGGAETIRLDGQGQTATDLTGAASIGIAHSRYGVIGSSSGRLRLYHPYGDFSQINDLTILLRLMTGSLCKTIWYIHSSTLFIS